MSRRKSIAVHFDRSAKQYSEEASLHKVIADDVCTRCQSIPVPRNILELGCGTGFLTTGLSSRFPNSHIAAVDISSRMIDVAKETVSSSQVEFLCDDALNISLKKEFDLVTSSSAIQWMVPFSKLFEKLASQLSAKGQLIFSLMVEGTLGELHSVRHEICPANAPRRRLPTVEDIESAVKGAGFQITVSEPKTYTTHYSNAGEFLSSIHRLGFTGGDLSTGERPLSRSEIVLLKSTYQERFETADGSVTASFSLLFVEAHL